MTEEQQQQVETIKIPKYFWGIIASLAAMVAVLLGGFFSWLGVTTTEQGKTLEINKLKISIIENTVNKISDKIDVLPPKEFLTFNLRLTHLEEINLKHEAEFKQLQEKLQRLERSK